MLALGFWEDTEVCPRCGGPKDLCQAPDARFVADPPIRCHRTDAVEREHAAWQADERDHMRALIPNIRQVPTGR